MKPFTPGRPLPIPDKVNVQQVDATTPGNIPVPSGAKVVRLRSLTAFYMKPDGTAAAPGGDVSDGTASILVPAATTGGESEPYSVEGVTNLSVLSTSGTILVHAEFWGAKA